MAPTNHYDYIVIGGGSGGVSTARRAASYGAKTLLIEAHKLGGTCVNVGCVPKKLMWNASHLASDVTKYANEYSIEAPSELKFDWAAFKSKRDVYVSRLNTIYGNNLEKEGVDYLFGIADFIDERTIEVKMNTGGIFTYTADHIALAVGGKPVKLNFPDGADKIGIDSDGFFQLNNQPKSIAVVGAGYIGVELAGVFNALGTDTHMIIRGEKLLGNFDHMISDTITENYERNGIHLHKPANITKLNKLEEQNQIEIEITYKGGKTQTIVVDELLWAVGREAVSYPLKLENAKVATDPNGKIKVDEYQNTSTEGIYALGDVMVNGVELTPVAIAAGRKLADRLFGKNANAKLDYNNIPSVVFAHPEAGSVGLSETAAIKAYGKENLKIYQTRFTNLFYGPMPQELKEPTVYKVICAGPEEKVVGIHIVGDFSSEILQGFGVVVKMGGTKKDLDSCVAIHPTAAEELVTLK